MIYKNVEIHNISELIENPDGSVSWLRIPQNVYDALEIKEQGQAMARNSTGVELRFVLHGERAVIRMSAAFGGRFHVYRGGVQGAWFDHEGDKNMQRTVTSSIRVPTVRHARRLSISIMQMIRRINAETVRSSRRTGSLIRVGKGGRSQLRQSSLIKLFDLKRSSDPDDLNEITRLENEVEEFCGSIYDPLTALCIREHYINGLSYDKIADVVGFGTSDSIRKRITRFVKGLPL